MLNNIDFLNDLPVSVRELIARLLLVVIVLLLTWLLRHVVALLLIHPLRMLTRRSDLRTDDIILKVVLVPVRYLTLAFAIIFGVEILATGTIIDEVIRVFARSMIIFALLLLIFRLVDLFAPSSNRLFALTGLEIEDRLLPFVRTGIKFIIIALGLVIILQEWGYDVSGLIAGFGLGGLAFSLAAQDTVSNLFGFTAIVSDNPFDVGEFIKTPDVEGVVEHVGLRSTRIRQLDQALVSVPNNKLANSAILNWSRLEKRRFDLTLGITYDTSSGEMRVLLHRIREFMKVQEGVDPDSVVVFFTNLGASSLDVMIRCFFMIADWSEFTAEKERVFLAIMDIVEELGLSIAFPSTSLYVENLSDLFVHEGQAEPEPELTTEERALLEGQMHEKPEAAPLQPDENITGQQDEVNG